MHYHQGSATPTARVMVGVASLYRDDRSAVGGRDAVDYLNAQPAAVPLIQRCQYNISTGFTLICLSGGTRPSWTMDSRLNDSEKIRI